jgi:hypothetical protein
MLLLEWVNFDVLALQSFSLHCNWAFAEADEISGYSYAKGAHLQAMLLGADKARPVCLLLASWMMMRADFVLEDAE